MTISASAALNELPMHLEAIRDAVTGEIVGRETQWHLPDTWSVEEYGLVDRWALRSALAIASEFSYERPAAAVHVDVRSVASVDSARELYQWLRDLRQRPDDPRLALEIDERFVVPFAETLAGFARAIRRLGFEVVIDNVQEPPPIGEVLKNLQCDAVKIDASLIAVLATSAQARETTARIARTAHTLGMYAIAAGVHDAATWQYARDLGCDRIQGRAALPI
jgi:EAL domain-containing protein (putative c-di-GMP-specific phosphodiesterase class I)